MKLVANTDLKNNTYKVNLNVLDITDIDREKISDFGEIVVNVGGVITGESTEQKYVAIQEPVTVTEPQTVIEKRIVQESQLVFEEDGTTPVYEEDGVTQKTELVDVEKDFEVEKEVEVPVLDENGKPVTKDKVDELGNVIYQLVEEPVEVVLADLGKVLRQFPSDFPLTRDFAVAEFGEKAEDLALAYIELVKVELEEKIALLDVKTDTFSGTKEYQL